MQQEQAFLAALGQVDNYFKLGGMLLLQDADFKPLMLLGAQN